MDQTPDVGKPLRGQPSGAAHGWLARLPEPGRQIVIAALLLGSFALCATGLLSLTHWATAERIADNRRQALLQRLHEVLPAAAMDNQLHDDRRLVSDRRLGSDAPLPVYLARRDDQPVAAVITVIAPRGYGGSIRLLVGVYHDGRIAGVRVTEHRETPGLGDAIEADRSDWIHAFDGRALGDPALEDWAVKRDGGAFDQFTGATITPRAVVRAVRDALLYFGEERAALFAATARDGAGRGVGERAAEGTAEGGD